MDLDSFQADMNAMRKLYMLVEINGLSEHSAMSAVLDEGTRKFLKKLLDEAVQRILEGHIKTAKSLGQLEQKVSALLTCSANTMTLQKEVEDKVSKGEVFSKNVDNAVQRIETLIPSLHRLAISVPTPTRNNSSALASISGHRKKIHASRNKSSISQESNDGCRHRKHLPQLDEYEKTSSNSSRSSSRKTGEMRSSSSSPSGTTQTTFTRSRCSGEDDDSDSNTSRTPHISSKSSSARSYSSSSNSSYDSGDDDLSSSERYQSSAHSFVPTKEGMFRRMKNKLGVIFHHHHHHHHHHHPHHPHDDKSVNEASGSHSVWEKEVGKKKLRRTEKKVETKVRKKLRKTEKKVVVKNKKGDGSTKTHPGHLRTLLGGLVRRVIQSRKRQRRLEGRQRRRKPDLRLKRVKLAHKTKPKLLGKIKKKPRLRLN